MGADQGRRFDSGAPIGYEPAAMASLTQITKKRRRKKAHTTGRNKRRARAKAGTPKFPIQPE